LEVRGSEHLAPRGVLLYREAMRAWLLLMIVVLGTFGCKSKQVSGQTPPPAYMDPAAAQEAMRQAQMVVQVRRGDVRNRIIPWSENLTLAAALVEADYFGRMDPLSVTVTRGRKVQRFSTSRLLNGADMFLEPGDVIDINR
jgi:hypothetical protein